MNSSTETHTLLATDHDGNVWADPNHTDVDWNTAIDAWYAADDARRAGQRKHVRHYEVRASNDPKATAAKPRTCLFTDLVKGRGFAGETDSIRGGGQAKAARKAIVLRIPNPGNSSGIQGMGGWYYRADGSTLAQGLDQLADIAEKRGWIAPDADGRWHVVAIEAEVTA